MSVTAPKVIVPVPESYLVEALTSADVPSKYLRNFPEEVYNTSPQSRLYKFIYSLIGPAGAGYLKVNYFYARLQIEELGLNQNQLDKFYGNPLKFLRSSLESYSDNENGILNNSAWQEIKALDESYRTRVNDYLSAARLGPTVNGMKFAAKSGIGEDVEIVENYQYLFNQHSDQIYPYNFLGTYIPDGNQLVEEFAVIPNTSIPLTTEQKRLAKDATDNLRPVNSIQTIQNGLVTTESVDVRSSLASSEYHQTIQFVTGNPNIPWPDGSLISKEHQSLYWVEGGVEKEAPRLKDSFQQHYQGFHQPISVTASSEKSGQFTPAFVKKFAFLKSANSFAASNSQQIWSASKSLAPHPMQLNATNKHLSTDSTIINYNYPADYAQLPNVPTLKYDALQFWSSAELPSGSEYLEIDFGSEKAVNFLILEMLGLPLNIKIEYDAKNLINSSGNPQKEYKDVKLNDSYDPDTQLDYDANSLNKWLSLPYVFTDDNDNMIYTRFIRITFTRQSAMSINQSQFLYDYTVTPAVQRPWSVIVKNMRLGRNV